MTLDGGRRVADVVTTAPSAHDRTALHLAGQERSEVTGHQFDLVWACPRCLEARP